MLLLPPNFGTAFLAGGHEASICSHCLQPGPGKPHHRLQPEHRHPGHHHTAEDGQREQRGQAHETDLLLRVRNTR